MALTWAESQDFEINGTTIARMGWDQAKAADSKLYDFLLMITGDDALVLVEQYEGMGFEAWRQLNKRYSPSGGQYEMDMMNALMNPSAAKTLSELPAAIDRFERNLRTYEAKTGRQFPPEWKTPIFMKLVPKTHLEQIQHKYQMGMRDYETLCSQVRAFSQEAWHVGRGVDDMQVDTVAAKGTGPGGGSGNTDADWQEWFATSSPETILSYHEQQSQDQEVEYMGRRKEGKGGSRWNRQQGGNGGKTGRKSGGKTGKGKGNDGLCNHCLSPNHFIRDCPEKKAGKPPKSRPIRSLEQEVSADYTAILEPIGSVSVDLSCGSLAVDESVDVINDDDWNLDGDWPDYEELGSDDEGDLCPVVIGSDGWPMHQSEEEATSTGAEVNMMGPWRTSETRSAPPGLTEAESTWPELPRSWSPPGQSSNISDANFEEWNTAGDDNRNGGVGTAERRMPIEKLIVGASAPTSAPAHAFAQHSMNICESALNNEIANFHKLPQNVHELGFQFENSSGSGTTTKQQKTWPSMYELEASRVRSSSQSDKRAELPKIAVASDSVVRDMFGNIVNATIGGDQDDSMQTRTSKAKPASQSRVGDLSMSMIMSMGKDMSISTWKDTAVTSSVPKTSARCDLYEAELISSSLVLKTPTQCDPHGAIIS